MTGWVVTSPANENQILSAISKLLFAKPTFKERLKPSKLSNYRNELGWTETQFEGSTYAASVSRASGVNRDAQGIVMAFTVQAKGHQHQILVSVVTTKTRMGLDLFAGIAKAYAGGLRDELSQFGAAEVSKV